MKTKTILLAVTLLLGLTPLARAQSATAFDYTGKYAIDYGQTLSQPMYESSPGLIGVGGPGGDDDYGNATQFIISTPTDINYLDVNAMVAQSPDVTPRNPVNFPTTFDYQIYSGTTTGFFGTVPNIDTLLATSSLLSFPDVSTDETGLIVPFDASLQPGTYWLAETGYGPAVVETTQGYFGSPEVAPVPEPPTFWLFLMIVGLVILRRNNDFGHLV